MTNNTNAGNEERRTATGSDLSGRAPDKNAPRVRVPARQTNESVRFEARNAPVRRRQDVAPRVRTAPQRRELTVRQRAEQRAAVESQRKASAPEAMDNPAVRSDKSIHPANNNSAPVQNYPLKRITAGEKEVKTPSHGTRSPRADKLSTGKIVRRVLGCIGTAILFVVVTVYVLVFSIAHGPSETMRNALVLSAMQASATKWVPGIFLSSETVDEIVANSQKVTVEQIDIDEYAAEPSQNNSQDGDNQPVDEWANSTDGVIYEIVHGSTYKAYILLIKDPSKVYVATSSNYVNATAGMTLFKCVEREHCLAAINGGEFADSGGMGSGATPIGLTYSNGAKVWDDGAVRTFMGFDKNDKLVVSESMTAREADELGIRDAVSFQNNNVLIDNKDGRVNFYYSDANTGTSQRTAIGQRADGTVIFLVTDGRSTSSLGATRGDVIDLMVQYGAVTAAMLDGGSSTMMYYEDYADKYNIDKSTLDEYQLQGMVNKYKAFTKPRYIPTYFCVRGN